METVGRVIRKFVKWMGEKGYMDPKRRKAAARTVDELKGDLVKVKELCDLIYNYTSRKAPTRTLKRPKADIKLDM